MQARLDASVMQAFAGAVAHAAFGRLRIRHISTLNYNFRASNDTGRESIVNREGLSNLKRETAPLRLWDIVAAYSGGNASSRSSPDWTN